MTVALLALCYAVYGYDKTANLFPTDIASVGATVATMTDGTVYTCGSNASLSADLGPVYVKLQNNGSVQVSPAKTGLREVWVNHTSGNISLNIYTSTDGSSWHKEAVTTQSGVVKATGINGDYLVKIENKSGSTVYITEVDYYTESCHCLRVVSE